MRQGELLALRWANMNLTDRVIYVRETWTDGVLSTPKSEKSLRDVQIRLSRHLGHSGTVVTERYAHWASAAAKQEVAALEGRFSVRPYKRYTQGARCSSLKNEKALAFAGLSLVPGAGFEPA